MSILSIPLPGNEAIARLILGPPVAANLDQIAANALAALAAEFDKGNFVAIELGAAPADGAISAMIIGTNEDIGAFTWDEVTIRFIVAPHDRGAFDAEFARIAAEQELTAADFLHIVDYSVGGLGQTLVCVTLWGPTGGPA